MRSLTCYIIPVYFPSAVSALGSGNVLNDDEFEWVKKARLACLGYASFDTNGEDFSGDAMIRVNVPDNPPLTKADAKEICPKNLAPNCYPHPIICEQLWGHIDSTWRYNFFLSYE